MRLVPPATKPVTSVARLEHHWFPVCWSHELKPKRPLARTLAGTPLVVFRTAAGEPAALLDRCAHRNVPLAPGKVVGERIACSYHGWEYDKGGRCQHVPGLCGPLDPERGRRVPAYPARDQDGLVWVYSTADVAVQRNPFRFPGFERRYTVVRREVAAPGTMHATLENALDVPHTAFLHGGLFRTAKKRNEIRAVLRRFGDRAEVEYIGEPRPSGLVGRILSPSGGVVTHFDRFFLPCVAQVEYRIGDENHFLVTSACCPVSDFETRMFAVIHFRLRLPGALVKPLLEPLARRIFAQDVRALGQQSEVIQRFGGERFESTELDLIGPQIMRLLKAAERGEVAADPDAVEYEKEIRLLA
ncbi:MAG: aromatic ring-hydroxylating dioxygenase subunit alpha [Deltaproteobacteria bacterium HGW-Deltaproteobacteria-14]|jgi:phenylpropionate dioxygenase-like ring-hydroxylating dioxygenase large terminal subunit|nr:MAG: aromatic ring-hydroxylating dioxygenase subunit alpha [Deltaproteobacteria bacterium HGW-Deltaproteobacteria-14]